MTRKMYWGLAFLILLLGAAAVFIIQHEIAENRELKKQLAETQKLADQIEARKKLKNNPPVAREGYKMVPHGDHWHEVPIDAPDTWEDVWQEEVVEEPPREIVSNDINTSASGRLKYTGPPTYAAYEKWLTEAFGNIERNEFGIAISPLPAPPTGITFETPEADDKADVLWQTLLHEEGKRTDEGVLQMEAYHAHKRKEAGLND